MSLQFPFTGLGPMDNLFGTIPNQEIVIQSCPKDVDARWRQAAEHYFNFGLSKQKMLAMRKAETEGDALRQLAYFNQWIDSLRVDRETKLTVCAWLLSLMLKEIPKFD